MSILNWVSPILSISVAMSSNSNPTSDPFHYALLDRGIIPDFLLRIAIRYLCRERLQWVSTEDLTKAQERKTQYIEGLKERPIAIHTDKANEQHYEVPTEFHKLCLGPRMKYSCCLYTEDVRTLEQAEVKMLDLYVSRAKIQDGMSILDLGCGWGSLCLYLAERYPNSDITALSNSNTQREHIQSVARERRFKNLTVRTGDVKEFDFEEKLRFDRVLSIEMFEHMKNYEFLLGKISSWLKPRGLLFVHIFLHKSQPYDFVEGDGWMSKYFFTGGTMPSFDTFFYFQKDLHLLNAWYISGVHYQKTSEAWLARLDSNRDRILPFLEVGYGSKEAAHVWLNRWRIFYLAVAEMFGMYNGQEWGIGHYLFEKKD